MSVDWSTIGNAKFDTIVETLLARRWRGIADFIAPDGRGGDSGIDIEVRQGSRRRVYQLKYFPDGFSGDRKSTRQRQIRQSFRRALQLDPAPSEWTLVVPVKLTPGERDFITGLSAEVPVGTAAPKIAIMDRIELDQLLMDYPDVYRYLAREEMRTEVELYRLETETLTGGVTSLFDRIRNLGELADSTDLHWGTDFARIGDTVTHIVRAKDPRAHEKNPITVNFSNTFAPEHEYLRQQIERCVKFGASGRVVLPPDVVRRVTVTGPEFIAGEYTGLALTLEPMSDHPKIGAPAELRFFDQNGTQIISHEGRISHFNHGSDGIAVRIEFYGHLHIELLFPLGKSQTGHIEVNYNFRRIRPNEALGLEEILTAINQTDLTCKVYIEDEPVTSLALLPAETGPLSDQDEVKNLLSVAADLKVVQDYCHVSFAIPVGIPMIERIHLRVARLLLDGYVTASPEPIPGIHILDGRDYPQLRTLLTGEPTLARFTASVIPFSFGKKELFLKEVVVFHPRTIALNGAEALDALDAGRSEGFRLQVNPGDDPCFYLAMPSRMGNPPPAYGQWRTAAWNLPGVTQPTMNQYDVVSELYPPTTPGTGPSTSE
ncbi:hypothetical protein [Nocardia sp. NPDC050412]|uniref:hypothetical protein n=1 Tax=Nocardia sp. NPDC050412 TaxID=3364320 RepID=UPI00378A35E0